jgi:hypothetical protein
MSDDAKTEAEKKETDDTNTDGGTKKETETNEPQTFTLKVDGDQKTYTMEELREAAQKSLGADAKLERASKMLKEAESGLKLGRLAQKIKDSKSPDFETQREFLEALGVPQEQIETLLSSSDKDGKGEKTGDSSQKTKNLVTLDNLGPREKEILQEAERAQHERIREDIKKSCEKSVDNDKVLGKMAEGMSDERRTAWLNTAKRLLNKDVERRILAREAYGPEMLATSLQTVRATLEEIGVPSKVAGQPPIEGLDYASVLGPNIHSAEPIKRVAVDDPQYEAVAAQRLQQMVYSNIRKGGK